MTLDEAITHAENVANGGCDECAKEHRQLAEWLSELKMLREEKQTPKKPIVWEEKGIFPLPAEMDDWGYRCPCCGNEDIDYPEHHCPCGQALDWSEIE